MSKKVIYPGSFDPITLGHLDIIQRASTIFDEVIVLVSKNINKNYMFSFKERLEFVELATKDLKNVVVCSDNGLLVDFMFKNNITTILKGIRNIKDFEYEYEMSLINQNLDPIIDTVFLLSNPIYTMVSSTNVRELIKYKKDLINFVPEKVNFRIKELIY